MVLCWDWQIKFFFTDESAAQKFVQTLLWNKRTPKLELSKRGQRYSELFERWLTLTYDLKLVKVFISLFKSDFKA